MKLLSELNDEGTTIIMVTHSPYDAEQEHHPAVRLTDVNKPGTPTEV